MGKPFRCWCKIWPIQNDAKKTLKNDWNPVKWVLIWEFHARAIQWIQIWQGLDSFQRKSRPSVLVLLMKLASALEGLTVGGLITLLQNTTGSTGTWHIKTAWSTRLHSLSICLSLLPAGRAADRHLCVYAGLLLDQYLAATAAIDTNYK